MSATFAGRFRHGRRGRTDAPRWAGLIARALRTRRGLVGAILVGLVLLVAAIGPALAPESPQEFVTTPFAHPSADYPLGGDTLGRDVLSRLLAGGWKILAMAGIATAFGVAVGAAVAILMRGMDVLLAFPQIVFALLLVSIAGAKAWLIVLAVAIAHVPQVARVVRSAALDVCERDFVESVHLIGLPSWRVMTSEILPNLTSPLMVELGLRLTYSIIIIAGLSFLGFGLQPPDPNWGAMINENRVGMSANPWAVIAPATLLAVLTVGMNTFTDAIARVSLGVDRPSATSDPVAAQVASINE
jgi:peptide/nickel transport system permease protein